MNIELRTNQKHAEEMKEGNLIRCKFINFDEFASAEEFQEAVENGIKNPDSLVSLEVEENGIYYRIKEIHWKKYNIDFRD